MAVASCPMSVFTTSIACLTLTVVIVGKRFETARRMRPSSAMPAAGSVKVASQACGAPAKVSGEKIMTKLMPIVSHLTRRKLAIVAVILRPSTLTVMRVADLQAEVAGLVVGERDERLAVVVPAPPFALGDLRCSRAGSRHR